MIESLWRTQIAFFRFAMPCGFFRGSGDEVQKVSVQGSLQGSMQEKFIWNHLWECRFLLPDPRVFPSLDDRFWHQRPKTEFMTGPYRQPSNQPYKIRKIHKLLHFHFGPSKTFGVSSSKMWKGGPRWWAQKACPFAQWFNGCTLSTGCEELHRICQRVQDKVNVSKLSRQFYLCCFWTWLLWLLCE